MTGVFVAEIIFDVDTGIFIGSMNLRHRNADRAERCGEGEEGAVLLVVRDARAVDGRFDHLLHEGRGDEVAEVTAALCEKLESGEAQGGRGLCGCAGVSPRLRQIL